MSEFQIMLNMLTRTRKDGNWEATDTPTGYRIELISDDDWYNHYFIFDHDGKLVDFG